MGEGEGEGGREGGKERKEAVGEDPRTVKTSIPASM